MEKSESNKNMTVSVVMPVYNAEAYLREAIDSVLAQTYEDIELIIVDDGSTDGTEFIVRSYNDDRIIYHKVEHNGISEALNYGIRESRGKYIARMDGDDIMFPDRIEYQVNFMEEHKEVDVLGGGYEMIGETGGKSIIFGNNGFVSISDMKNGNVVAHPTVMMRKSSMLRLPFLYEKLYDGVEDYKMWYTAITHGLKVFNDPKVVLYYRQGHMDENKVKNSNKFIQIKTAYDKKNNEEAELTCIIPFQNEGFEVERTVMSIRYTAHNVNIILIDDCSYDGYDYEKVAEIYHCEIYRPEKNLGVAGARDFGISLCKTPYFILFDAHMRIYHNYWDKVIVDLLKERPTTIFVSNTSIIYYENGTYVNEDGTQMKHKSVGAAVKMNQRGLEFTNDWTHKLLVEESDCDLVPVSCALGAVYAATVKWWNHIGGLGGLVKWGYDETYFSIKTWLAGGEVNVIRNWPVGHIYREKGNYDVTTTHADHNQMFLINFFCDGEQRVIYEERLKTRLGIEEYTKVRALFVKHYDEIIRLKNHFWKNVAIKPFSFFEYINEITIQDPKPLKRRNQA